MNIEVIDNILAKKVTGEATSSEIAILESWRKESIENEARYNEYALIWDHSSKYSFADQNFDYTNAFESHLESISTPIIKLQPTINTVSQESSPKIFSIKRLSSIAAILVLGIASLFVFDSYNTTQIQAENGIQFASLADGSKIWLNEGSSLSYKKGFGETHRNLDLEGKAFFDVNRNEEVPFVIEGGDLEVSVLGTSFTVDVTGGEQVVTVSSGKVAVESEGSNVILTKDQKATLKNNQLVEAEVEGNSALWRNMNLIFNEAPIEQVIDDINMFHDDKLVLNNSSNVICPFTSAGLASESFENIVSILKTSYDLEVKTLKNGQLELVVTDCN